MRRDTANGDFQMKFSYRDTSAIPGPEAQVYYRYADGNNMGLLRIFPNAFRVAEYRAGSLVNLVTGTWSTTSGTWYDVTVIADGQHIELWRGPKGGAQSRVCSVDNATVLSGSRLYIMAGATGTYSFDDFQMSAEDLSATSYTYNTANELTAMTANGAVTNFTYDAWGRMIGKAQGGYSATYSYRNGDKLALNVSGFPGEAAIATWDYDGLGKRRQEIALFPGQSTQTTWFRWSGWEESGEYAAGTGGAPIGALQTGYVPGLAAFAGSNPATADWCFNLSDHLGSPRQMLGQDKSFKARQDFSPYGELMRSAGLPLTVGYTGHRWDPAIGQYFAPFRYYNPQTTRWNTRDPLGYIDGPNVYAYAVGNPTSGNDPLGTSWVRDIIPGLGGPLGGGVMGGILGGLDQAGCSWSSIAAGALLGGLTGAVAGLLPGIGGVAMSIVMGALDSYVRGGSPFVGGFGGALGGGISVGLKARGTSDVVQFIGGLAAGTHINFWPNLVETIDPGNNKQKPCLIQ